MTQKQKKYWIKEMRQKKLKLKHAKIEQKML